MAHKIFITSDMSDDERLIEISETDSQSAMLWPWFLTLFDDWGRAEFIPKRIKAKVFPLFDFVSIQDIERIVKVYADHGLIMLYEVNSRRFMAISREKWFRYQTHIRIEKRTSDKGAKLPPPPDELSESPDGCMSLRVVDSAIAQERDDSGAVVNICEDARQCATVRDNEIQDAQSHLRSQIFARMHNSAGVDVQDSADMYDAALTRAHHARKEEAKEREKGGRAEGDGEGEGRKETEVGESAPSGQFRHNSASKPKDLAAVTCFLTDAYSPECATRFAAKFFNHYEANGWTQCGLAPIVDWHAQARKYVGEARSRGDDAPGMPQTLHESAEDIRRRMIERQSRRSQNGVH